MSNLKVDIKVKTVNKWVITAYAYCIKAKATFLLPYLRRVTIARITAGPEHVSKVKLGELIKYQP